jgi:hypothetical protein
MRNRDRGEIDGSGTGDEGTGPHFAGVDDNTFIILHYYFWLGTTTRTKTKESKAHMTTNATMFTVLQPLCFVA